MDSKDSPPSSERSRVIDAVRESFESALRRGEDPSLESALERLDESLRPAAFPGLLRLELEHRLAGRSHPTRSDYESRFPEFIDAIEIAFRGIDDQDLSRTMFADSSPGDRSHSEDFYPRQFGEYELLEEIARGGMGVIYRARQRRPNRIVAIKMIRAAQLADAEQHRRFHLEAEAAAQLHHPAIVPIYEVGEVDGQHFFSMRYVKGMSLAEAIRQSPLPTRQALRVLLKLCDAIDYAHRNGVIHRDLKPSNVLLAESESSSDSDIPSSSSRSRSDSLLRGDESEDKDVQPNPVVTDFGLAKQTRADSELTAAGQILGTPSYMSPEQARGEDVGPATDIYGLGAVLYEALTGRPPFQAANVLETMRQVKEQDPVPPEQLNPAIDRDVGTVCQKCLEKNPSRRYAFAAELAADLRRILLGEPIKARPITVAARLWRWCRRRPAVAALSAALFSLLLALAVGGPLVAWKQALLRSEASTLRHLAEAEAQRANRAAIGQARARRETRRYLYVAHMNLAQHAWAALDVGRVSDLLDRHRTEADGEDFPGFEWYYWWRLAHRYELSLQAQSGGVNAVAVSDNRKMLASAGDDGTVRLWDAFSGNLTATLQGHSDHVRSVDFSPDSATLASAAGDGERSGEIILWDVVSGEEKIRIEAHIGEVTWVAFSPNGETLASAGNDGKVNLWEADGGILKQTLVGHADRIKQVAFSGDGAMLASCGADGSVKLWDANSAQLKLTLDHRREVTAIAVSPDGRCVASAMANGLLQLWDAADGRRKATQRGHVEPVVALAFAPNGQLLASGSLDRTVKLWRLDRLEPVTTLVGHTGIVLSVSFSPDSKTIVSGGKDDSIKLWTVTGDNSKVILEGHSAPVRSVAFSPRGRSLASAAEDHTVRLYDVASGDTRRELTGHADVVRSVVFSPDGNMLASGSDDASVILWDLADDTRRIVLRGHTGPATCVSFSPDGKQLASGSSDRTIILWDPRSGTCAGTFRGQTDEILTLAFSPDGKTLASAGHCHSVMLWDVETRQLKSTLPRNYGIRSVVFSPDGEILASGGSGGFVRIYNVATGQLQETLQGHTSFIQSIAFSPDGKTIASASRDRTIKLWDRVSGEQKASLVGHDHFVSSVAFSPDGATLASGSWDTTVHLWRAAKAEEVRKHEQRNRR